ncbi:MAG: 16S rRNA (guanine(527)-N(7))-methyltransferase RsmG [Gracilibacteraceae bacterium]|jgi:16S rRNA (guanine527-N7)-methyltransferase|nr:16S rRNA (guanine(527)-N(7))-methyltransferase RsmG [Gracilibacteraceae bacterium]
MRFGAGEAAILRAEAAARWGLELPAATLAQFCAFGDLLAEWNKKMNLTAITEPADVVRKHFLDSLAFLPYLRAAVSPGPPERSLLLDLGAGAGFPGLPLKLAWSASEWILGDSRQKRLLFLETVVAALSLRGVRVLGGRAEEWGRSAEWRGRLTCVTARAVAPLAVLVEYALPLLRVGGVLLAAKGPAAGEEAERARRALCLCGGEIGEIVDCTPAEAAERRLLVRIIKTRETPDLYPRPPGRPAKHPL